MLGKTLHRPDQKSCALSPTVARHSEASCVPLAGARRWSWKILGNSIGCLSGFLVAQFAFPPPVLLER